MALKRVGQFFSVTIIGLAIVAGVYSTELKQLYMVVNLFKPDVIVHNFSNMQDVMTTKVIKRSGTIRALNHTPKDLPKTFTFKGQEFNLDTFLSDTQSTALLVVKNDDITFENYYLGTHDTDLRASWSMAKSYLSAIFGIAVYEGHIKDLNVPVTDYVPALVGSGYDGVTIKNVLQMSSGVAFNEDYNDFNSDINRFARMMTMGGSFDEFAASLTNEREQGTYMKYVSIDTHVLGMVLRAATGKTIEEYLTEKLWSKLGNEQDARYLVDGLGEPMVLGGLNATTRDYGRLGMLFRDNGMINGEQVVPAQWIKDSITPDAPHGPPYEINTNIYKLAKKFDLKIALLTFKTNRFFRLNNWDKLKIPLPFSKGIFFWGEEIINPSQFDENSFKKYIIDNLNKNLKLIDAHF